MLSLIPYLNFLLGSAWLWFFVTVYVFLSFFYFVPSPETKSQRVAVEIFKYFFVVLVAVMALRAILRVYFQYFIWKGSVLSSFLLPPHQSISYFLRYSFTHHLATFLLTAVSAIAVFLFLRFFRKKFEGRERKFCKEGEEYIFFSGLFLTGWPLLIPYMFLSFILPVFYMLFSKHILREEAGIISVMPFFAILAPILVFLKDTVIFGLFLKSLIMPW